MSAPHSYIGRFAPTPSGPLHFGSLVSALASYLDAKANQGKWLLRIEDLDPPREDPAASNFIPKQLLAHHLQWDGEIEYQSRNHTRYEQALSELSQKELLFPCQCSRKDLQAQHGLHHGPCRSQAEQSHALRIIAPQQQWCFTDRVYGESGQDVAKEVGDFVLKRKDGLYAYQLAMVVDDHHVGVTHVVRGVDLLDNTPRQLFLMAALGYDTPIYMHIPLIVNEQGQKLSKQNQAKALDLNSPLANLLAALEFLNQPLPPPTADIPQLLTWATEHWQPQAIAPSTLGLI